MASKSLFEPKPRDENGVLFFVGRHGTSPAQRRVVEKPWPPRRRGEAKKLRPVRLRFLKRELDARVKGRR
jgi:hypothetical protein